MPRKEEVVVKKKKGACKASAEDDVPKAKLDLTIRDKKSGDKKKGASSDGPSKGKDGSKSKPASEKPELDRKAPKAKGKPTAQPETNGDYLGDMDLPPSSSSEDENEPEKRQPLYTGDDKRQDELKVKVCRLKCIWCVSQRCHRCLLMRRMMHIVRLSTNTHTSWCLTVCALI